MAPESTPSSEPEPRATRTVRSAEPRSMALAKVTVLLERAWPRRSSPPLGMKDPDPQATWAPAPPRLTVRAAPVAAKPVEPVRVT